MNLYIVRHGEAAPLGGAVTRDADRPLTPRGEEDARLMGGALTALGGNIGQILSSPLTRAVQTARLISSRLPGTPPVSTTTNLSPGFRPKALLADLAAAAGMTGLILVGHQPDLGELIAFLVGDGSGAGIAFPAGAAAKLSVTAGSPPRDAALHWLLTPEAVRRLQSRN